jgi:HAD superfamily hydrolase (TIGR01509 family)
MVEPACREGGCWSRRPPTVVVGWEPRLNPLVVSEEVVRLRYALVIFDMDGTLIEQLLDFAAIRREIGMPADVDMLGFIESLPTEQQASAYQVLERHEMRAAEHCVLFDGAAEVIGKLRRQGIGTALLTRNSVTSVKRILGRHRLSLDLISTRESLPYKPHPDSITNIRRQLNIPAQQALMVGDYLYDLQAAHAAGVDSALFWPHQTEVPPTYAALATHVIPRLSELLRIND